MEVKGKKIGFVFTGSFCIFNKLIPKVKKLRQLGADIFPVMLEQDFKDENSKQFISKIENICEKDIFCTREEAMLINRKHLADIMIIAPASGEVISKLANDTIDNTDVNIVKSNLRNKLPVVIAPYVEEGLRSRYD